MTSKALHAAWRRSTSCGAGMDMQEDESSGVVAHALTSEKPKKAKFRNLQNSHAHLPFVDGEEFIGGVTIVEMCQEREEHV
jgi:hypothetical protein